MVLSRRLRRYFVFSAGPLRTGEPCALAWPISASLVNFGCTALRDSQHWLAWRGSLLPNSRDFSDVPLRATNRRLSQSSPRSPKRALSVARCQNRTARSFRTSIPRVRSSMLNLAETTGRPEGEGIRAIGTSADEPPRFQSRTPWSRDADASSRRDAANAMEFTVSRWAGYSATRLPEGS